MANKLTLSGAQINPFTDEKYLVIQVIDENNQFTNIVKQYDECDQDEKTFVDNCITFAQPYIG